MPNSTEFTEFPDFSLPDADSRQPHAVAHRVHLTKLVPDLC